MRNIWKRKLARGIWATLFWVLSCLLLAPLPVLAAAQPAAAKRVGYLVFEDVFSPCGYHAYSGYGYEYLEELAQYTGWTYEFIPLSSWQEGFTLLEEASLDMLAALPKNGLSKRSCAFPELGMGLAYATLLAGESDGRYAFADFGAFDGMRVGVIAGSGLDAELQAYGREHGFHAAPSYFNTLEGAREALAQGQVDALLLSSLYTPQDLKVIAKFAPQEVYFATAWEDTETLEALNDGLWQIQQREPYFNAGLSGKYYDCQAVPMVGFTREELDFIQGCGPLAVACEADAPPFCYYDAESQEYGGAAIELLHYISEETGLQFTLLPAGADGADPDGADPDGADPDGADLVAVRTRDFSAARRDGLVLTTGYARSQVALAARGESLPQGPTLAVPENFGEAEAVEEIRLVTGGSLLRFATEADCLEAVRGGHADAALGSAQVLDYYLANSPQYNKIRIILQGTDTAEACLGVSQGADPRLISILDKAIAACPSARLDLMLSESMKAQGRHSLLSYIYANPLQVIGIVGGSLLAILLGVGLLLLIRERNAHRMKKLIYTDALTGHGNYKTLHKLAPRLIQADPAGYALLYMDAYQFKFINDTFGYDAGDEVLIAISKMLERFIGKDELFARVYADKFVLLLRYEGADAFQARLDALSQQLSALDCKALEHINLIFNGGVYCFKDGLCDLDNAFDRANYAMNTAQPQFSNTFVFYDRVISQRIKEEKELESHMYAALEKEEIVPFYQPKVNVLTGAVIGAEALARWMFPDGNNICPADFIPFFERNGFVTKVDFHIFELVCRDIHNWLAQGQEPVPVSVNLSRRHIDDESLAERLLEIATKYQVPPSLLELEITETVALDNLDRAVAFAKSLNACGFPLSIDDYGTGFSSIALLQRLPLNAVKLDKTFIESAMESAKAKDIMRHLVMAIKNNGIQIICEGIERPEQVEFMKEMNCIFAQGFLYARPMPGQAFIQYLGESAKERGEPLDVVGINDLRKYTLASEDFLNRVMPGGIILCSCGEGFPIYYANQHLLENLGYGEQEFIYATGGKLLACMRPEDRDGVADKLRAVCQSMVSEHTVQARFLKKGGEELYLNLVVKKVITRQGETALLCVCTDVTPLVKLQEDKNALVSTIPGGVHELLLVGNTPVILSATDRFYEIIGHSKEEFNSGYCTLMDIIEPQDIELISQRLQDMNEKATDMPQTVMRIRHSDGSLHWVSVQGTLRVTEHGKTVTAICQDIDNEIRRRQEGDLMRRKFQLFMAVFGCGEFVYDFQFRAIVSGNRVARKYLQESCWPGFPGSIAAQGLVHPEDIAALTRLFERAGAGNSPALCQKIRLLCEDGGYKMFCIGLSRNRDLGEGKLERQATGMIAPLG